MTSAAGRVRPASGARKALRPCQTCPVPSRPSQNHCTWRAKTEEQGQCPPAQANAKPWWAAATLPAEGPACLEGHALSWPHQGLTPGASNGRDTQRPSRQRSRWRRKRLAGRLRRPLPMPVREKPRGPWGSPGRRMSAGHVTAMRQARLAAHRLEGVLWVGVAPDRSGAITVWRARLPAVRRRRPPAQVLRGLVPNLKPLRRPIASFR